MRSKSYAPNVCHLNLFCNLEGGSIMSASRRRRFTPAFDHLEQRTVPAGNILAVVDHGVLNLYGDAEANQISITSDTKHNVTVTSLDDTTINGQDSLTFKKIQGLTVF